MHEIAELAVIARLTLRRRRRRRAGSAWQSAPSRIHKVRLDGIEVLAGWKGVIDAVHSAGGRIIPQLWHQGMSRKPGTGHQRRFAGLFV